VIEAGARLIVSERFLWDGGTETATLTVAGELSVLCENQGELARVFRAAKDNTAILNILPGANVYCPGQLRGADIGGYFQVNMSGGDVNVGGFKIGDNGDGDFYMSGGTFRTKGFFIRGRGGAELEVFLDGGARLLIEGPFAAPEEPEARAKINIDDGYIECTDWRAQGYNWVLDINDGCLRIKDAPAGTLDRIQGWIDNGQITGYNGTVTPQVTTDRDDVVVTVHWVHREAWYPHPPDKGGNVCPGDTLTWRPGAFVDTHTIYFGDTVEDVNEGATPYATGLDNNSWTPPALQLNTHYYWRVDEVNDPCVWTGGIWEFDASDGNAFPVFPLDDQRIVPVDSNLTWRACEADSYNVYFSFDFDAVVRRDVAARIATGTTQTTADPCVGGDLEHITVYYWTVDLIKGGQPSPGEVWDFKTAGEISDPNMCLWYKFDEASGSTANDSSGYDFHAQVHAAQPHWLAGDGKSGGCLAFNADTTVEVPLQATGTINSAVTVSCWLKDSYQQGTNNWIFSIGDENYQINAAVVLDDTSNVQWRAGNDTNDVLLWDMREAGINPGTLRGWQHWTFVKNENPGELSIYFNGQRVDTNSLVDSTLNMVKYMPFYVGALLQADDRLLAKVDEFKLFDKALTENEVVVLYRGGDLECAWGPDPFDGQTDVPRNASLGWQPRYLLRHQLSCGYRC